MPAFKGTTNLYQVNISDLLAINLREWIRYGLLETGAYTNVTLNSAISGYSELQQIHDDRYIDGQVYEFFGPNLVYQNDVSTNDPTLIPPIVCSGIYINQQFFPTATTSGYYGHTVDFERGRLVLNNPQDGSGIYAEYCINDVSVQLADTKDWKTVVSSFAEIREYNIIGTNAPSGLSSILKEKRVWLPSIFIDIQDRDHTPLQLGGGEYANFNVFYHIFSELPAVNKSVIDLINDQEGITLNLFNPNTSPRALNYDGSIYSGMVTYRQLSDRNGPYFFENAWIEKSTARPVIGNVSLFRGEAKQRIQIQRYGYPNQN